MGCDIHLFVEYGSGGSAFRAVSDGAFLVPADYALFAALAGVRAEPGVVPLHPPRGLPGDVSPEVATRYFVPVLDTGRAGEWHIGEHFTPDQADGLVSTGSAQWRTPATTTPMTPATHGHISHPDWHAASWLAADELHRALDHAGYRLLDADDTVRLVLSLVDAIAARKGSSTRIVFWFDN